MMQTKAPQEHGFDPARLSRIDTFLKERYIDTGKLPHAQILLSRNGEIEETGVAMGVLGHPATGVAWLANKFAQHGARLEAGEIILAGSFTRPMWVQAGDEVRADFGPMGVITCRFS